MCRGHFRLVEYLKIWNLEKKTWVRSSHIQSTGDCLNYLHNQLVNVHARENVCVPPMFFVCNVHDHCNWICTSIGPHPLQPRETGCQTQLESPPCESVLCHLGFRLQSPITADVWGGGRDGELLVGFKKKKGVGHSKLANLYQFFSNWLCVPWIGLLEGWIGQRRSICSPMCDPLVASSVQASVDHLCNGCASLPVQWFPPPPWPPHPSWPPPPCLHPHPSWPPHTGS